MFTRRLSANICRSICNGVDANFSKIEDLPSPRGLPFIGTALTLMAAGSSSRLHKYIDKRHRQLGPLFRERVGIVDAIFVSDADVMRSVLTKHEGKYPIHILPEPWILYNKKYNHERGLLFMEGEEWYTYRKIMNKIMLRPNTENWMEAPVSSVADNLIQKWDKRLMNGVFEPNLEDELYKLSLDVVLSVVLGSAYDSSKQSLQQLLARFSETVHDIFMHTSKMYMLPVNFYAKLNLPVWKGFEKSVHKTLDLGRQLVEQIYNFEDKGDGLLHRMMDEGLNLNDITRILTDLVIAAGDTTAFTTQWTLYLLSVNQGVVDKYRSLEPNSDEESKYMKGIIRESMRIYPVAPFLTRILPTEQNIAGYQFPAGTIIVMSIYTSGRDSQYFSQPLQFNPERWNRNDQAASSAPHATLPFAIGSRSCIGQKIAMLQMKQVIDKIVRHFDLNCINYKSVEDHMQMILKPKNTIRISFKQIHST